MDFADWIRDEGQTSWTAHAGFEGGGRALSADSFLSALRSPIDRIEFDLFYDRHWLMAHDKDEAVMPQTLTLDEGLRILSQGDKGLTCDIKNDGPREEIAEALLHYRLEDRTLICGHDSQVLKSIRAVYPFPSGWSFPQSTDTDNIIIPNTLPAEEITKRLEELIKKGGVSWCQGLMLRYDTIQEPIVSLLHALGKWVVAWTVDDLESAKKMIALGVDGITSNKPFSLAPRLLG